MVLVCKLFSFHGSLATLVDKRLNFVKALWLVLFPMLPRVCISGLYYQGLIAVPYAMSRYFSAIFVD